MRLRHLPVFVFDCQTTSTSPERGYPIEVAWTVASAESPAGIKVESRLVRLPAEVTLPDEISMMTGLDESTLREAADEASIWNEISSAFSMVPRPRVMVSHYARFELGFLKKMHERLADASEFPFAPLCTHLLAKKLLPDLPAWGIRALSGYFGSFLPELKRAESHVLSTLRIWSHLVDKLEREQEIASLDELREWMHRAAPARKRQRAFLVSREKRLALSDSPGIYRMRSPDGTLLYIGKATSLRSRVNSYFRASSDRRSQLPELLTQVSDVEVVETVTSLEAALLETDEIKRFQPPYNISLMDRTRSGRTRRLYYFSQDLEKVAPEPGPDHPHGPFLSEHIWQRLRQLAEWAREAPAPTMDEVFGGLESAELFHQGMERLFADYREKREDYGRPRYLLGRGLRRWRRHGLPQVEEESPDDSSTEEARVEWTSELIAKRVEKLLIRAAQAWHRAYWCCRLTDASLSWDPRENPGHFRWLAIRGGQLAGQGDLASGDLPPLVSTDGRSRLERQKYFDVATYDRMRTLLTEVYRLSNEERAMRLRLPGGRLLSPDALGTGVASKTR